MKCNAMPHLSNRAFGGAAVAALVAAAFALGAPRLALGATPAADKTVAAAAEPVLRGVPSGKARAVTLDVEDESVADILRSLADDAGWDVVLSLPVAVSERALTLRLRSRPAVEALEVVLRAANLRGEFAGTVLTVKPGPRALREAIAERIARERQDDEQAEPDEPDEADEANEANASIDDPGSAAAKADAARALAADKVREEIDRVVGSHRGSRREARGEGHRRKGDESGAEVIRIGNPLTIEADEVVESAVTVGAPLLVRGHVLNDAVAIGGPLRIAAGATVDGEAVAIGGPIDIEEGARVRGNTLTFGGPVGGLVASVLRLAHGDVSPRALLLWGLLGVVLRGVALFVIALLLLTFVPERVRRTRELLLARPGACVAAGLAVMVGFFPLLLLLIASVVGIPLVPVALIGLLALPALGMTGLLTWLGDTLPLWTGRKTQLGAMLLGLGLVVLIDVIPVLGSLVLFSAAVVTAGAAALSRYGSISGSRL